MTTPDEQVSNLLSIMEKKRGRPATAAELDAWGDSYAEVSAICYMRANALRHGKPEGPPAAAPRRKRKKDGAGAVKMPVPPHFLSRSIETIPSPEVLLDPNRLPKTPPVRKATG